MLSRKYPLTSSFLVHLMGTNQAAWNWCFSEDSKRVAQGIPRALGFPYRNPITGEVYWS